MSHDRFLSNVAFWKPCSLAELLLAEMSKQTLAFKKNLRDAEPKLKQAIDSIAVRCLKTSCPSLHRHVFPRGPRRRPFKTVADSSDLYLGCYWHRLLSRC